MTTIIQSFACAAILLGSSALSQPVWAETPAGNTPQQHEKAVEIDDSVLTLSEAIQKALDASPRLKSASAGLGAAKGAEEQAGVMPNPEFEVMAENIAGSGNFSGIDSAEITYGLSQEIELGGKRSYRKQAAAHGTTYGEYGLTIERLNLIRDVKVAYHDAVAAQEKLALAEERKTLAKEMQGTVNKRVRSAAESAIQLRKAEIGLSTATVIEARARREFEHTKHVLASLWAGHDEPFYLSDDVFFELSAPPTEETVENNLAQTADLKRWDSETERRKALYELEKAEAIPDPRVTLGVRDFRANNDQALVAGISIPIPVFNSNSGNIVSAKSRITEAESNQQATYLTMRNEVFESLESMMNAYSHATTLKEDIIPAAQQSFKLARNGYGAGRFPYLEVLDAQRTLFEVKEQYIEALKEYHTARANVERMTTKTGEQK